MSKDLRLTAFRKRTTSKNCDKEFMLTRHEPMRPARRRFNVCTTETGRYGITSIQWYRRWQPEGCGTHYPTGHGKVILVSWLEKSIYIHTQLVKFCIIFAVKVDTRLLGLSQSVTRARMHVLPSTAFAYIYYYTTTVKSTRSKNRKKIVI